MVIQYKDATTYADLLVLFDHLGARLHALRQRLPYGDEDARNVGLRGMQVVLAGYAMGFSSMIFERTQADIIRSFGRSTLSPDEARQIVEDAWRLGLLTLFQFKIDSLFQNLLRALGLYNPRTRGFSALASSLLEAVSLPARVDARRLLSATAYLRNSLHNNGIHRGPALSLECYGLTFVFTPDTPVQCASWQHILAILDSCIDLLEQLFATPEIRALAIPIPDQFALEETSNRAKDSA